MRWFLFRRVQAPLKFEIGDWVDEFGREINVSDVKILLNDEELENLEISDEGTFTLSSDLVKGEFTIQAQAQSNGREFKTNEINIMASSEAEDVEVENSDNDSQTSSGSSSGGCNTGVVGIILCGAMLLIKKRN